MRSPRSRAGGLGALCLLTFACTNGEGIPLVMSDASVEAAADGGVDAALETPPAPRMDAAMPTTQPRDAGTVPKPSAAKSECEKLEDEWPASTAQDADALLSRLDVLRAMTMSACGWPAVGPLRRNSKLECAARIRLDEGEPLAFRDFEPSITPVESRDARRKLYERLDRADFNEPVDIYELLITNTNSLESFVNSMQENLPILCTTIAAVQGQLAGAARKDHVWVVYFSYPTFRDPHRP